MATPPLHGLPRPARRATASSSAAARVAPEKVHGLLDCEANVTVVAPQVDDELRALPVRIERARVSRAPTSSAASW